MREVVEEVIRYLSSFTWYRKNGGKLRKEYQQIKREYEKNPDSVQKIDDMRELDGMTDKMMEEIRRCIPKVMQRLDKRKTGTGSVERKTDKTKARKEYIPGYRTAAYAILRVLHDADGVHKHYIGLKAVSYTDVSFDSTERLSGYGSFKTLLKNGLIYHDKKYYLTDKGRELCERIFQNSETVSAVSDTIEIVIDSREKKSGRNRVFFQSYFNSLKIPNTTRHLGLGDFVWIKNEKVLNYIVERKGATDFMSSISDGRYREQKNRLRMFGGNVFYILEGVKEDPSNRDLLQYCKLEVKMEGFTVIETEDIGETGRVLAAIDEKIREGEFREEMSYGSFLDEGGKREDGESVLLSSLLSVRGLGKESAVCLSDEYGTIGRFLEEMESDGFQKKLSEKKIGNRKIGDKMAAKIMLLFE